jgi:cytochrome c-type biogenesis protein CcmE
MSSEAGKRRTVLILALAAVTAVIAALAMSRVGESLVYYWSPTELKAAGEKAVGASIRLGGLVVPGSVERTEGSLRLTFRVTDGTTEIPVVAEAVPPPMFREGIGVVVEGTMAGTGGADAFQTRRLMVKHDNEYRAPGAGKVDMKDVMKSLKVEDGKP